MFQYHNIIAFSHHAKFMAGAGGKKSNPQIREWMTQRLEQGSR